RAHQRHHVEQPLRRFCEAYACQVAVAPRVAAGESGAGCGATRNGFQPEASQRAGRSDDALGTVLEAATISSTRAAGPAPRSHGNVLLAARGAGASGGSEIPGAIAEIDPVRVR